MKSLTNYKNPSKAAFFDPENADWKPQPVEKTFWNPPEKVNLGGFLASNGGLDTEENRPVIMIFVSDANDICLMRSCLLEVLATCTFIVPLMNEWTIKTPNPICRLFFKIDLLKDIAALCLTDFMDWRYIHSVVCIFDPACELLPLGWRNNTCVLLPLNLTFSLTSPRFWPDSEATKLLYHPKTNDQ